MLRGAASFFLPRGVATDSAGNVYWRYQQHTIRKITPQRGHTRRYAGTAGSTDATERRRAFVSRAASHRQRGNL